MSDKIAGDRNKFGTKLSSPGTVFKSFSMPCRFLSWDNVLPGFVIARAIPMMESVEDAQLRFTGSNQNLMHVRDAPVRFGDILQSIPYLTSFRDKVVIGVDHKERGKFFLIGHVCHSHSPLN